jgi:hypothetical protein
MSRSTVRLAVGTGVAVLVIGAIPASTSASPTHSSHKKKIGDSCLVGTWRDEGGKTSTLWDGTKVPMHYHGGDVDHIKSNGHDHDNWKNAKKLTGHVNGSKLTEHIHGKNTVRFSTSGHGHKASVTEKEKGWSNGSTNKYHYRGKHVKGYLSQTGSSTVHYTCTSKKWKTYNKKGKVVGTEKRLSNKP